MDVLLEARVSVRVLVRTTSNLRWIPSEQVEMVTADVRNAISLRELVKGVSWVFHFGGITRAASPEEFFRVNTEGTKTLAEALLEAAPEDGLFLFCSSLAASGPAPAIEQPRRESDPPRPITPYGESKLAAERWLEQAVGSRMRLLTIRPPAIYGPRDEAMLSFFQWVKRGWLPLPPQVGSRVSLIHARDLAQGCLTLAEKGEVGIFHFADGVMHSWEDVGEAAGRAMERSLRTIRVPAWGVRLAGEMGELLGRATGRMPVLNRRQVQDILQPYWICETEKARRAGWVPKVRLGEGILQTVTWYQSEGWL